MNILISTSRQQIIECRETAAKTALVIAVFTACAARMVHVVAHRQQQHRHLTLHEVLARPRSICWLPDVAGDRLSNLKDCELLFPGVTPVKRNALHMQYLGVLQAQHLLEYIPASA
jgi:hypothetical protein